MIVVPGFLSALAGPIFAGVPVTQRGVAESFTVCTGVGKGGKAVKLPGYERSQALVILMGIVRLGAVLDTLQNVDLAPECQGHSSLDAPSELNPPQRIPSPLLLHY